VEYLKYIARFGKSYGTKEEFIQRAGYFKDALAKIMEFNSQNSGGQDGMFHLAINKFADWSHEEYRQLLGYKNSGASKSLGNGAKILPTDALP
jgi:hypothetical protein